MSVKKNKKKKEKHIVGTKELIFDIVSVVLIICLGFILDIEVFYTILKKLIRKR